MGQRAGQSHLVWYYSSAEAQCSSCSTNYEAADKAMELPEVDTVHVIIVIGVEVEGGWPESRQQQIRLAL